MNYPYVYAIPEICHQLGIKEAIIAPGSRSAPLTIAFARHPDIHCRVIPDERSAAFIAMGIAQATNTPLVLICTSGSAALNFAPAIAEAYFQQIPLLILTADRPPEWIDQLDGQTIRQTNIYGKHVKKSFSLEVDLSHQDAQWHSNRIISESINLATRFPKGPVHINVPFREPLYPESTESKPDSVKVIRKKEAALTFENEEVELIKKELLSYNRILIVCGQDFRENSELDYLDTIIKELKIPVIGDIISNIHGISNTILHSDIFLSSSKRGLQESLQPDLLLTFGKSVLSKNLKLMLRKNKPREHWHIQPGGYFADTYQSITKTVEASVDTFLKLICETKNDDSFNFQKQENYFHIWQIEERKAIRHLNSFFPQNYLGEFEVAQKVINQLTSGNLHLANSMSVRYGNFVGLTTNQNDVKVFSNRGTSGIDGCTSTAIGVALTDPNKLNVLITGDMAFFYDRNAFWHNYKTPNLRILVLNNHAGGIFRIIKGPSATQELEEYFETNQRLTAKYIAKEFGFEYLLCDKRSKLSNYVKQFLAEDNDPKILEIETSSQNNKEILEQFKAAFEELK